MSETIVQVRVDGRRPFTAGLIVIDGIVAETAPILRKWILGKTAEDARALFRSKGWRAVIVTPSRIGAADGRTR